MAVFIAKTAEQLGALLRGYRRASRLTQRQLAARVGWTQKAISLAETRPAAMSVGRLFQLLNALGVELTLTERSSAGAATEDW